MSGSHLNTQDPPSENPQTLPRCRKAKRRGIIALVILLALALLCLGAYWFSPQVLCVDSGAVKADVIVVLGGDMSTRPDYAAALFRQGCAPDIVVSGAEAYREILLKDGVPEHDGKRSIHHSNPEADGSQTGDYCNFMVPFPPGAELFQESRS
jgi:hypothetical protein